MVYNPMSVFCLISIKIVHINHQLEFQVDATISAPRKLHEENRISDVMNWHFDNFEAVSTAAESA